MTKLLLALVCLLAAFGTQAQPRYERDERPRFEYPRWCEHYDRRQYWRERRACGADLECRRDVRRKARRCGLRV